MTRSVTKPADYAQFLNSIKSRIRDARIFAARAVNKELITLYWSIGKDIIEKQEQLGWGKSVVEELSKDLKSEFPGTEGFSAQNLWYMRQLYTEYR
jgi:predicted nuclease of restriction endonuclease-like (RecB) superfamily